MPYPTSVTAPASTVRVSVLAGGWPLPMYRRSDGRMFVPAPARSAYTLHVTNLTGRRVEVIATVDGRHVLRNEPGDPRACQGFVIGAHAAYEFRGWRVDDDRTDEFLFGSPSDSVAVQADGSAVNIGVIGIAAWREYEPYGYSLRTTRGDAPVATASAGMMGGAVMDADMRGGSVGTGIGARQHDPVGRTSFSRTGEPDIAAIGYDTEAELIRRGIAGPPDADPFPGAGTGYAAFRHS